MDLESFAKTDNFESYIEQMVFCAVSSGPESVDFKIFQF